VTGEPRGVAFNEPPAEHLPGLMASIEGAFAHVPADKRGALVTIWTDAGANAALVVRAYEGERINVKVETWIGKSWGTPKPSYGVATITTF
jgi:hypothetical protein